MISLVRCLVQAGIWGNGGWRWRWRRGKEMGDRGGDEIVFN